MDQIQLLLGNQRWVLGKWLLVRYSSPPKSKNRFHSVPGWIVQCVMAAWGNKTRWLNFHKWHHISLIHTFLSVSQFIYQIISMTSSHWRKDTFWENRNLNKSTWLDDFTKCNNEHVFKSKFIQKLSEVTDMFKNADLRVWSRKPSKIMLIDFIETKLKRTPSNFRLIFPCYRTYVVSSYIYIYVV